MLENFAQPHLTIPTLEAYLDNTLTPEQKTAVQTHLQNCPQCRHWLAQESELSQRLSNSRPHHLLRPAQAAQIQQQLYQRLRREKMMNNIRVSLRTALALVILLLAVGGIYWWQNLEETADQAEPTAVATPIPNTDDPITITFAARSFEQPGYQARIDQFEALYPEINVQFVPLDNAVGNAGISPSQLASLADTAVIDHVNLGSSSGAFRSLEPLRDADATFNSADFWPGTLEACQSGNQLTGLPVHLSLNLIFYNADLFAEAGIAPPAPDWTWADFLAAVQATARPGQGADQQYGFVAVGGSAELLAPFVAANASAGGKTLAASLEPLADAYAALIAEGAILATDDFQTADNLINNNQAAMWLDTQQNYNYRETSVSNVQMAPVPQVEGVNSSTGYVDCLVISAGSTQPDAAWTWLKFLTNNPPPDITRASRLPARPTVAEADDYWQSRLGEDSAVGYAVEHAFFDRSSPVLQTVLPLLAEAMVDGSDLTAVLPTDLSTEPEAAPIATAEPIVVATPIPEATEPGVTVINYYADHFAHSSLTTIQAIADEFNASQTAVRVTVTDNILPGAGGFFGIEQMAEQFDCFASFPPRPEHTELLYSLTPLLAADETGLADDFYPGLLAQFTMSGELYGLPNNVSPTVIYYNADLLAAQGIEPPDLNWKLEDMLALASQSINPEAGVTHGIVPFQGDVLSWFLTDQGVYPYDVSTNPPSINFDNPNLLNALELLVVLHNDGVMHQVINLGSQEWDDNHSAQEQLVVSGKAPFWGDLAALYGGFTVGEIPEFVRPAALPIFNGRIDPPTASGLFISRQAPNPQACWAWLVFLSGHPEAPQSVPARISVAESAAWEAAVGAENAAVFRTSLERQAAHSTVTTPSMISDFPLSRWWGDVINAAYAGQPIEPLLAAAQQKGQLYVACMSELTAPTRQQMDACAKEADPEYKTLQELR